MKQDRVIKINTRYYQQYGTDHSLEYPSDGIGGWKSAQLPLNVDRTAIVVMHASYAGEIEEVPEQFKRVEYLKRCYDITARIFPKLLGAAREAGMSILHVPFGSGYYEHLEGYRRAVHMSEPEVPYRDVARDDDTLMELYRFRADYISGDGAGAAARVAQSVKKSAVKGDFLQDARPAPGEGVAATANQLAALAVQENVNHLIYMGYAVDGCLLTAPGGMMDMLRRRFMCSVVSDAVTAIENRESGREQMHLENGLWRVGSGMGFVYESAELIRALKNITK